MFALLAFVVVSVATGLIVARLSGWNMPPDPPRRTIDFGDTARKMQSVLSSLAAYAVTSIVLLITLTGNRLSGHEERIIDLIALLVVSYLGFVVGGLMYAHTEPIVTQAGIDMLPAQHAIASTQFYRSIISGFLALGPMVAIVGADRLTGFVFGLLLLAVLGGWTFEAANLRALGFGERRFAYVAPLLGVSGSVAYLLVVQLAPGLRAPDSALYLVAAGAAMGAAAHFSFHSARLEGDRVPAAITRWIRAVVIADAHASVVLTIFTLFALAGLI